MIQYIEIKTSSTIDQISNKIRRQTINSNDSEYVKKIMNDVKKNKDKALLKYSTSRNISFGAKIHMANKNDVKTGTPTPTWVLN